MKFDAEAKFGRKYRLQRVNYSLTARDSHTTRGSNVLVIANMITNTQKNERNHKEITWINTATPIHSCPLQTQRPIWLKQQIQ